jgi:pyruvate dehydrogenase E2 component (dihydrolipoamide acetyltransferase)
MAVEFMMPKLGLTMEAGTIIDWLVADGDQVESGQPVLVIETDKVESEVEATGNGVFHRVGEVGTEYPCGAHIGWLLDPGEDVPAGSSAQPAATTTAAVPAADSGAGPSAAGAASASVSAVEQRAAAATARAATGVGGRLLASPNARRVAAERGVDLWSIVGSGPGGRITSEDVVAAPVAQPAAPAALSSSPAPSPAPAPSLSTPSTVAARQLADLLGVDLSQVVPAGADPRVTRDDVAAYVRTALASANAPTDPTAISGSPAPVPALQTPSSVIALRGMRGTIAERMSASLHSMAQLTLNMDVDMSAVAADRVARKDAAGPDGSVPGFTDYIIAAAAAALVEHPVVNSQIIDDGVALLPQVNVGLAVALDDGLIVPVVADTPSLGLEELADETTRLATAARAGKLTLNELEGGTFSVTALGMFDVDGFTPIINAPNTAILGVGRLRDEAAWNDAGGLVRTTRLTLSLTWDHRAFDGAPAARFVQSIKRHLEDV